MPAQILFAAPEEPRIAEVPEKEFLISRKCGVCYEIFGAHRGDTACHNCERWHCPSHTDRVTESELTPELCTECGEAYRLAGQEGLKSAKIRLFHTHGS